MPELMYYTPRGPPAAGRLPLRPPQPLGRCGTGIFSKATSTWNRPGSRGGEFNRKGLISFNLPCWTARFRGCLLNPTKGLGDGVLECAKRGNPEKSKRLSPSLTLCISLASAASQERKGAQGVCGGVCVCVCVNFTPPFFFPFSYKSYMKEQNFKSTTLTGLCVSDVLFSLEGSSRSC